VFSDVFLYVVIFFPREGARGCLRFMGSCAAAPRLCSQGRSFRSFLSLLRNQLFEASLLVPFISLLLFFFDDRKTGRTPPFVHHLSPEFFAAVRPRCQFCPRSFFSPLFDRAPARGPELPSTRLQKARFFAPSISSSSNPHKFAHVSFFFFFFERHGRRLFCLPLFLPLGFILPPLAHCEARGRSCGPSRMKCPFFSFFCF